MRTQKILKVIIKAKKYTDKELTALLKEQEDIYNSHRNYLERAKNKSASSKSWSEYNRTERKAFIKDNKAKGREVIKNRMKNSPNTMTITYPNGVKDTWKVSGSNGFSEEHKKRAKQMEKTYGAKISYSHS